MSGNGVLPGPYRLILIETTAIIGMVFAGYDYATMSRTRRTLIALLSSILALPLGFLLGFYLLLLVDPHYHDGISLVGGFVVAVIAAAVTFRFVMKNQHLSIN